MAGAPRIPISKAEILAIQEAVSALAGTKHAKVLEATLAKVGRASSPSQLPAGIGSQRFIEALSETCKVAPVPEMGEVAARQWHGRVGKVVRDCLVTEERAKKLGAWISRQKWTPKPISVDTVVRNMTGWLAQAEAAPAVTALTKRVDDLE